MEVEMIKVEIEGFVEITMLIHMKPKKNSDIGIFKRKVEEFREEKGEKEENSFLKTFYPESLVKKIKVEPKICSYRLL